ncbi:MAG: group 1 glycosyl transferase [Chloroflexi bacterium]|nr:group 1 glycosyl transferase [Chloroflexota bacterium]|tara:strand:+ start:38335 stop:39516 length:1182 start_codon:yes stop_codon:yes gene_type:complete
MKIALCCPASLPATQFGGILFLCLDIAKESSKRGHDVTIYTTDLDFANNPKTFNKNLPRKEKIQNFWIKRSHTWFSINLFFVNPGMYFEMSRDNFDIIHTIGIRSFQSFIAALISKKKKIPLVISDQGGLTTHPELTASLLKKILVKIQEPFINFIIKSATKISVPNEYEKNIFLEYCDESKITVIPNGINLDIKNSPILDFKKKYNIPSNFVLFLGRFSKIKGLDILLQSIHILKKQLTDKKIKFIIMGVDFGFETEMLNTIRNLNISELVSVIKNPPREDVIQAYRESNFLVYPSRWELSPLTPLEAFAFKKAVISTDAHGIPFTLQHGKNSLLVKSGNSKLLAEAILELINDEKKCNLLGNTGHELVVEKCNSNQMVKDTLVMYEQLIKE